MAKQVETKTQHEEPEIDEEFDALAATLTTPEAQKTREAQALHAIANDERWHKRVLAGTGKPAPVRR